MQHRIADDIAAALGDTLARLGTVKEDMDKQARAMLANALDRLDLVTRDEFDVQQDLLSRLTARVAVLEERLNALAAPAAVVDEDTGKG
ncbi:accessory factor UbiK family protein [Acidithiobacillus ferrianus]|uniref:Ubiquinone biosynthesis accessory factor UbiK n=2 Tax=Acidithiobacillus ferrianus TaxID=2678518 RepID=A0A845UH71_9PROT|nr:accessory factor UbiK family protein [Acidithiobacillus ferrianus]NDU43890.1 accessory factor UbiK family protein [Acidithiobacillus ferrianus]